MRSEFISDVVCSAIIFIGVMGMIGVVVMFESYQENTERIIELRRYREHDLEQREAALKAKRLELIAKYPDDIASFVSMSTLPTH